MPRVVVISPPFASHARPLSILAAALAHAGAEVHFACSEAFAGLASRAGVHFEPLTVTRNANTGVAESTKQQGAERRRLLEFFAATRAGAVPALVTQARHRRADMMADPGHVLDALRAVDARLRPDWYVVDQLSYSATLALHCLGARYAAFCPGHPSYVLAEPDQWFGVPYDWPEALRPAPQPLRELMEAAQDNDSAFTVLFEEFIRERAPRVPLVERAFALTSSSAVVYAYPPLPWLPRAPKAPQSIYAGHMVGEAESLDAEWRGRVAELRERADLVVLVALGTFLSVRDDVLRTVVEGVLRMDTRAAVIVAAGERVAALNDLAGERVLVARSVPQQALLRHVDVMVHHGGGNSFTECLQAAVPALVLPFSSDQFAIARDAERTGVGIVRDPNTLCPEEVASTLATLATAARPDMLKWTACTQSRGPHFAASRLLSAMD
ncbi:glycosyltransferase [Streptomyces sp. HUAS MG91]|uniref:Glycosyltransferase n=1 Tax=Streptomyces tabacisoli TaxID=3156398 RepID=A0AAU8J4U6_9ACTN